MAKEICDILEYLLEDELVKFKWDLSKGVGPGISPIPRGKLENAKNHDVADLMVQQYGAKDAGKIAVRALQNIKQNQLALQLKETLKEVSEAVCAEGGAVSEAVSAEGGASSGAADVKASPAGVNLNINCNKGGNVKAPVVQGAVFSGPVTFS